MRRCLAMLVTVTLSIALEAQAPAQARGGVIGRRTTDARGPLDRTVSTITLTGAEKQTRDLVVR
jgi:hypothetical protein